MCPLSRERADWVILCPNQRRLTLTVPIQAAHLRLRHAMRLQQTPSQLVTVKHDFTVIQAQKSKQARAAGQPDQDDQRALRLRNMSKPLRVTAHAPRRGQVLRAAGLAKAFHASMFPGELPQGARSSCPCRGPPPLRRGEKRRRAWEPVPLGPVRPTAARSEVTIASLTRQLQEKNPPPKAAACRLHPKRPWDGIETCWHSAGL